eukprot:TRINITY_DN65050_c0_g1_i1.p1 TRINITY_DN65050_c0_g1~~TRINITY_DN65050_c0_g1_i1.p1  ORF type:complete len:394 (+),score=53.07 TRINITY_DN65050_c0_g1_i1:94-1275(+)
MDEAFVYPAPQQGGSPEAPEEQHRQCSKESRDHRKGLIMGFTGIMFLVPDGTLVRMVHEPSSDVAAWYLLLTTVSLMCVLVLRHGFRQVPKLFRDLGFSGVLVAVMAGAGNSLFVFAVGLTSIADVVVLLATSPFWAALWSKLFFRMPIPPRTLIAMPIVLGGVVLIVSNGFDFSSVGFGDAVALIIPIVSGLRFTITKQKADVDMLPALILGNLLVALGLFATAQQPMRLETGDIFPLVLDGLICNPLCNALLYEAARFLHPSESGMIMCLETALSPLLAWAVLGDQLTPLMLTGGSIVITTLIVHSSWPAAAPKADARKLVDSHNSTTLAFDRSPVAFVSTPLHPECSAASSEAGACRSPRKGKADAAALQGSIAQASHDDSRGDEHPACV